MTKVNIERQLWYQSTDKSRIEISQSQLLELSPSLVILGEAGMGKSYLLSWLAAFPGSALCTANKLINRYDPKTILGDASVLVIDGLDEVSSQKQGDAVNLVLQKLGALGYPRFILSCRVADWRSATGIQSFIEQTYAKPIELHLLQFTDADALAFLSATLGQARAISVFKHFYDRGLNSLLNSPQTLEMIARVAEEGDLPNSRRELFAKAIEVLRQEHSETRPTEPLARDVGLDAAGAAFAGLILTGSEAVSRLSVVNLTESDVQLVENSRLPGGDAIAAMLDSRLFRAVGVDRFSYLHRTIGEYQGAQWLAKQADTPRKRSRLLALFQCQGLVPASLRGMHAWLAQDPHLSKEVIAADPMGVIEYGDADELTVEQARGLMKALELLAAENPRFRDWGPYSLRGILKPALLDELRRLITSKEISFGLRRLILEAIKGSAVTLELASDLLKILLDTEDVFALRSDAGEALVALDKGNDWSSRVITLYNYDDQDSVRLALELMDNVGYEDFDDELIVNLAVVNAQKSSRTICVLWSLERNLPDERIAGVLDCLSETKKTLGKQHECPGIDAITDFAYHLIARAVAVIEMTADKLWSWLEPFEISEGHNRETRLSLDAYIRSNDILRRAVQRLVLIDLPGEKNLRQRAWRLKDRLSGFSFNSEDIVALFNALDSANKSDERWCDVTQLAWHDGEEGAEVRAAARVFTTDNPDLLEWLDGLANQPPSEWKIEEDERQHKHQKEQAIKREKIIASYETRIDKMRAGEYGVLVWPAKAYLKLFNVEKEVPAQERVVQWLGDEIGAAALAGFENFLLHHSSKPSAHDIAQSLAVGTTYDAEYVIIAALAERHRNKIGFDELTDEILMAGLFALRHLGLDSHAGINGVTEAVEATLKTRCNWEVVMRGLLEPQLNARCEHFSGLYQLMHDETCVQLASQLAAEWLARFDNLPAQQEIELIDRLLRSSCFEELRHIAASRSKLTDDESRRRWNSIALLVDFEQTKPQLEAKIIEPELLWHLRARIGGRYGNSPDIALSVIQLEWIINTFRPIWPNVEHPSGLTSGENNAWDAAEFILQLIRRLGNESSLESAAALKRLHIELVDGYSEYIKVVIAEQQRVRVESSYTPPSLEAINAILRSQPPQNQTDLQTLVIELLSVVQAKIKSDAVGSWRGFFSDDRAPHEEERCRDHLLSLLYQEPDGVVFGKEEYVADDKRVDITCTVGNLWMPIEIKGQWHRHLWTAADMQLDEFYAADWRADKLGIYLVFWFGSHVPDNKCLTSPGRRVKLPETPEELKEMLGARSLAAQDGRVVVFVLDLSRPEI